MSSVTIDGVSYTLNNSSFTASVASNTSFAGDLNIPSSITVVDTVYTVTSIDNYAFNSAGYLNSVAIPDTIKTIGNYAFVNCNNLTSFHIQNTSSLTSIGQYCFRYSGLPSISLPDSLTVLGRDAFRTCANLTSIGLPSTLISIGRDCFNASGLISVTIPESVTEIISAAFGQCSNLTSIIIPNQVTILNYNTFYGCSALTSVILPASLKTIDYQCFYKCQNLTTLTVLDASGLIPEINTLPNTLTSIGVNTFQECVSLISMILPASLKTIDFQCFYKCENLTTLTVLDASGLIPEINTLPNTLTSIGYSVFRECKSLTSMILPNSINTINYKMFESCTSLGYVILPSSLQTINYDCFLSCNNLTTVTALDASGLIPENNTLPNTLTDIGKSVFKSCTKLSSMILPSSLINISESLFESCGITSVTIQNSVSIINNKAFYNCTSLTYVNLPNAITSLGFEVFYGCSMLQTIETSTLSKILTNIGYGTFQNCSMLTYINLPYHLANYVTIGHTLFKGCTNLTSVNLPAYICNGETSTNDSIPHSIFHSCSLLSSIEIPTNVKTISDDFCNGCSTLTHVDLPETLTYLGNSVFNNCVNLSSIIIPSLVNTIGTSAFNLCLNLISVTINNVNNINNIQTNSFTDVSNNLSSIIKFIGINTYSQLLSIWNQKGLNVKWNTLYDYYYTKEPHEQYLPTITNFFIPTKTYRDDPFDIIDPSSTSNGTFSYTSSDTSVATILNKTITIMNAGQSTITATQAETEYYLSGTKTFQFVVNKAIPIITNFSIATKLVYDPPFEIIDPSSTSNGTFSYTSSDTSVATISGKVVTMVGVGSTYITATQEATQNFESKNEVIQFDVINKRNPIITDFNVPTKIFGELPFIITDPSSNSDGSFNYFITNNTVANITENMITIVGVGSTDIIATQAETDGFFSGTISASFEVLNSIDHNNQETPIYTPGGLKYMLSTTAGYGNIETNISFANNTNTTLQSEYKKTILSVKGIKKLNG